MLLSARMLNSVADVNHWEVVQTLEATQGDAPDIYFVLTDASVEKTNGGRRFVAAGGATLQVTLQDMDSSVTVTRTASQPFPGDLSIWKLTLDPVLDANFITRGMGTYALKLRLSEPTADPLRPKVTSGFVSQAINIARTSPEF